MTRNPERSAAALAMRETLCDRVMLVQTASGLTKRKFAKSIGISETQLANYAAYTNTPAHAIILQVSQRYGIPLEFFYGVVGERVVSPLAKALVEKTHQRSERA